MRRREGNYVIIDYLNWKPRAILLTLILGCARAVSFSEDPYGMEVKGNLSRISILDSNVQNYLMPKCFFSCQRISYSSLFFIWRICCIADPAIVRFQCSQKAFQRLSDVACLCAVGSFRRRRFSLRFCHKTLSAPIAGRIGLRHTVLDAACVDEILYHLFEGETFVAKVLSPV